MAKLTAFEKAGIQSAIDLLVQGSAHETPFALDVIERLSPVIDSLGVSYQGKSNYDFVKDNPVSALIGLVWVCGAFAGTLTDAQARVLLGAVTYMGDSTAREEPFAEDVIQRIQCFSARSSLERAIQSGQSLIPGCSDRQSKKADWISSLLMSPLEGAGALIFVWNSESTFSKLRSSFGQAGSQYSGGPKKGFPLISMFSRRTLYRNSHRKYAGG